jgi:hypothetical protein
MSGRINSTQSQQELRISPANQIAGLYKVVRRLLLVNLRSGTCSLEFSLFSFPSFFFSIHNKQQTVSCMLGMGFSCLVQGKLQEKTKHKLVRKFYYLVNRWDDWYGTTRIQGLRSTGRKKERKKKVRKKNDSPSLLYPSVKQDTFFFRSWLFFILFYFFPYGPARWTFVRQSKKKKCSFLFISEAESLPGEGSTKQQIDENKQGGDKVFPVCGYSMCVVCSRCLAAKIEGREKNKKRHCFARLAIQVNRVTSSRPPLLLPWKGRE